MPQQKLNLLQFATSGTTETGATPPEIMRREFAHTNFAASLEAEWNVKLRALAEAEQNYELQRQADQFKVSAAQREQVLALATDFPRLWNDSGTANRERKRMVRLLIEDITIRKGEQIQLHIRFRGGAAKTLMLPKPLSFCESHKQNPAMVAEMDRLLDDYNYADTARILKRERVQDRRRLAADTTRGRLYSKSLWTEEPIRPAPRTRPADHL